MSWNQRKSVTKPKLVETFLRNRNKWRSQSYDKRKTWIFRQL